MSAVRDLTIAAQVIVLDTGLAALQHVVREWGRTNWIRGGDSP